MKKKQLSDERIDELMTVYDVEVAATLANELSRDFAYLYDIVSFPNFISINHVLYFELMLSDLTRFPEFKGLFDHLFYGLVEEILVAPEAVDFSEYAVDCDIKLKDIPEEIRVQLRPLTREDVLEIAKKIEKTMDDLSFKFFHNIHDWIEEDGVDWKDLERQHELHSLEETIYGAFSTYFTSYPRHWLVVPFEWDMHEYLMRCWELEPIDNYNKLQEDYESGIEERNERYLEHEVDNNYDYLRNHVFNCIEA